MHVEPEPLSPFSGGDYETNVYIHPYDALGDRDGDIEIE
jgi:hypothetical protein